MVRDWFYADHVKRDAFSVVDSPQEDMRQRAVDKVNLWLFKAGQLPAAMVSTASLTDALLHDERADMASSSEGPLAGKISDQAMQSIYAMAFARFVNAFVDRDVARSRAADLDLDGLDNDEMNAASAVAVPASSSGSVAAKGESSMYAHAQAIGMPVSFVDLRHQVTHGDVPGLIHLRKMTLQALQWLWDRWWVKNATGDPSRSLRELAEHKRICSEAKANWENQELDAVDLGRENLPIAVDDNVPSDAIDGYGSTNTRQNRKHDDL